MVVIRRALVLLLCLPTLAAAQFTIPNLQGAAYRAQAAPDSGDFAILTAAIGGTGVVSGCQVTAQVVPDMTVAVASGVVIASNATTANVTGATLAIGAAASSPRIDLVTATTGGVLAVVQGTPGAVAVYPATANIVLAAVYVPAGTVAIDATRITDKRVVIALLLPRAGGTLTGPLIGTTGFFANGLGLGNTSGAPYANLYGDAANTLALRNGGTAGAAVPQTFNVYNFCDGAACVTGYEKGAIIWNANVLYFGTQNAGTGTARVLAFMFGGTPKAFINTSSLYPNGDGAIDLGIPASNRFRTLGLTDSIQGSRSKTISDASATAFVRIALPQTLGSNFTGGSFVYTLHCDNGTTGTYGDRSGKVAFTCANIAGTESCTFDSIAQSAAQGATYAAGAPAWTATGGADTVDLNVNSDCTGVVGPTTFVIHYRLDMTDPQTVTPQ